MRSALKLAVVDTSVVSILFNVHPKSETYSAFLEGTDAFISFQTLEERHYGAYLARWGARRMSELTVHLEQYTVIWPNADLVDISARIRSNREQQGRKLHAADAWVAATALLLNCPLVTDDDDFEGIPKLDVFRVK